MMNSTRIFTLRKFSRLSLSRNHHVAIVGTGPSGFYTAKYLVEQNPDVKVDFFEKLPFPFGLVRYGVAPDHPEVKSACNTFEEVVQKTDRIRYFGNITISDDITDNQLSLEKLSSVYDAVVLAYGANSDNALRIPGENLQGVLSSRDFVNWYNGHPEFTNLHGTQFDLSKIKHVVVVGQGNVALDCARILAKSVEELQTTDISQHAIEALKNSSVETITIIGRRGHVQAAFTIKELRELTKIPNVSVNILKSELQAGWTKASQTEAENNRPKKRILELIDSISNSYKEKLDREISIRFLLGPKEIVPTLTDNKKIGSIVVTKNELTGEPHKQNSIATSEEITLPCDLLLKSIGYKCTPISKTLPFNIRANIIPSLHGRVVDDKDVTIPKLYVAGWLKRGPTGIIGSNIGDAKETSQSVLEDLSKLPIQSHEDPIEILKKDEKTQSIIQQSVTWEEVLKINQKEIENGQKLSPPKLREKFINVNDMLEIAKRSQ